ncbi:DUF6443 domain-containing protein [Chryseolinea lacunae]|uniref:DUF6443 domain-containing protein n=1 Tax=Chryseolinea lacunae TaxID=2801331 RepID=A0ABS1KWN2_9BACT|nr:DUF6443 domain-containing protein [Chryseolinea lacunae]MBL0743092.1 hypothetical protein [Chryseolinea lacunae]
MRKIFLLTLFCGGFSLHGIHAQNFIYINSNNSIQTGTPSSSFQFSKQVILAPGFSVNGTNGVWYARPAAIDLSNVPPSQDKNYVRTETVFVKGITTETAVAALPIGSKSLTYNYVDGLGRSSQDVNVKASPGKSDLVQFHIYGNFGREPINYLSYVSSANNGLFRTNAINEQAKFYSGTAGVAVDSEPFSKNEFEDSPLNRVTKSYGAGWSWHTDAESKPTTNTLKLNNANEVQKITLTGSLPTIQANNFYPVNTLQVQETTDESGQIKRVYTNFKGQVILERLGDPTEWHDTYHVYDDYGNAVFVFPPDASFRFAEYTAAATVADKQAFLNLRTFQYTYDAYGRVISKRIPGAESVKMIYDNWDRLVLTQDGNQRGATESATSQWTFTKYDVHNRTILTGYITGVQTTLEAAVANATVHHEDRSSANAIGYTNVAFPSHSDANLRTISYYDDYAFKGYAGWDAQGLSYTYVTVSGFTPTADVFTTTVKGYATGAKVKNLDDSRWLNSVTYYDKQYRTVQTISENHLGGQDVASTLLDFVGNPLKSQSTHTSPGNSLTVVEEYTYDDAKRLLTRSHQIDAGPKVLMVSNRYNELGQLIEKNIHSTDNGVTFLQSVDTRYNIRGWITSINNSTLTNDGVKNDDTNDVFGMEFLYDQSVSVNGFDAHKKFDGNIAAIKWKTDTKTGTPVENIYGYSYDIFKRFKQATYGTNEAANWSGKTGAYNEAVSSYDRNGNIGGTSTPALSRYRWLAGAKTNIDNLAYRYSGNQLLNVSDAVAGKQGFADAPGIPYTLDEVQYDRNGNLISDLNKTIGSITYNHLNLPTAIEFTPQNSSTRRIKYTYDALGVKLGKTFEVGTTQVGKTDYVEGIQLDNGKIAFISTAEGRAVYNGTGYDYEYLLKDHQNNVRVVYGSVKETVNYLATVEGSVIANERNVQGFNFPNPPNDLGTFNYTKPSDQVPAPVSAAVANGFLNTGLGAIGMSKSLRVLSGDAVYMEVYARYSPGKNFSHMVTAAVLASAVTTSFNIKSSELPVLFQNMTAVAPGAAAAMPSNTTLIPRSYLVYLFFDDNYVFQTSSAVPVSDAAASGFQKLSRSFTANKNGYLYMYVANESDGNINVDVFFDDFRILHQKNNATLQVLQASDYYPYGLSFNEYQADRLKTVGTNPTVYGRTLRNRYLFQNQELQSDSDLDFDLGLYQYKYRMHDPSIGRFGGVDPLAEKYLYNGTYVFSENRLVNGVELEGLEFSNTLLGVNNPAMYQYGRDFALSTYRSTVDLGLGAANYASTFASGLWKLYGQSLFGPAKVWNTNAGVTDWGSPQNYRAVAGGAKAIGETVVGAAAAETGGIVIRLGAPVVPYFRAIFGSSEAAALAAKPNPFIGARPVASGAVPLAGGAAAESGAAQGGRELFNFTKTATAHMDEAGRMIPVQTLDNVIKAPLAVVKDPRSATNAMMHYSQMWKNGKLYNVEVLYDQATNTIMHFKYSNDAMGPLLKIPK